jgi:hypothetical protein
MMVEENNVKENPSGGIMSRNHAKFIAVTNVCSNNGNFQISVTEGSEAAVLSNLVSCPADSIVAGGIVVTTGALANLEENIVTLCSGAGIVIAGGADGWLLSNRVSNCISAGVRMEGDQTIMLLWGSTITDCEGPGLILESGTARVDRNVLVENGGGGIVMTSGVSAQVYNNTIASTVSGVGRGIFAAGPKANVFNNIIYGYVVGIYQEAGPSLDYNCTFNNQGYNGPPGTGGANAVEANPLFVDLAGRDFHLSAGSPCINAGNPESQYNDPDQSRSDIGCYYYSGPTRIETSPIAAQPVLEVWPSIASDAISLRLTTQAPERSAREVLVLDMGGRCVGRIALNEGNGTFNTAALPPGQYLLRCLTEKGALFAKFFVMR